MVAGKSSYQTYEIRSGMSVQDLKQLTAQRAQRQRKEFWELQARNSPRQPHAAMDWSHSTSSAAGSPERRYGTTYYTSSGRSRSPSTSPNGSERMFITCGGQMVSFMEGVVNLPQMDSLPDSLSPL